MNNPNPIITPQKIDFLLGDEQAPPWMYGQNICNLRDMSPRDVAPNRRTVLHLIREAYRMGILVYDSRGFWSLNSNFGDIMDWMARRHIIMNVIREASVEIHIFDAAQMELGD